MVVVIGFGGQIIIGVDGVLWICGFVFLDCVTLDFLRRGRERRRGIDCFMSGISMGPGQNMVEKQVLSAKATQRRYIGIMRFKIFETLSRRTDTH